MRLVLALAIAIHLPGQFAAGQTAPAPEVAPEVHQKTVELIEATGMRERLAAALPEMIEKAMAATRKRCAECSPEFFAEWGKRMAARFSVDDIVNLTIRAHEKRFTLGELEELLTLIKSQKAGKPVAPSPELQKKSLEVLPAIMGEITGALTEKGPKLGAEIGAEIEKEHPEYLQSKPGSEKR